MKRSLLLSILISNSKVSTWKCILGMTIIKRIGGKKNCFFDKQQDHVLRNAY